MNEEKKPKLENVILLMKALHKACSGKAPNTPYKFTCPICGGEAYAVKSGYNGHHSGSCEQCQTSIIE